ncbi:glycosyltransferase family 4 protein [Marinobacter sp. MMG032]|uniref:Glycosyltransferase family 4 protein n=1 Tax=Marinobacter sp. MMG032 TaxID=3158548 RepID=A0AAU7MLF2_9GAMM
MKRKRILLITRNLPPLVGGMERLNWHMADELSKKADLYIVGPKGSNASKPSRVTLREAPLTPLILFFFVALYRSLLLAFSEKPDIIIAGSGLTAPLAWLTGKVFRIKSAVYLHGFDVSVDNRMYRMLWRTTFKRLNHVIVNSTSTKNLAMKAGVSERKLSIIFPGVELPPSPQPSQSIAELRARYGLENKKILLSVGRLTTRKGLLEFVESSMPNIVNARPDVTLVVVGEAPKNSLGAGIQSERSIMAKAEKLGIGNHIKFLGVITKKEELATVYEAADVHVFPVRHIPDDPEGFGMVAIEAAAHGLPTVAFSTGGIVDAVAEGQSGKLVTQGDYNAFSQAVVRMLYSGKQSEITRAFARQFEWKNFEKNLLRALWGTPSLPESEDTK